MYCMYLQYIYCVCIDLFVICFDVHCRLPYYTFLLLTLVDIHMTGIGQFNSSYYIIVVVYYLLFIVILIHDV